MSRDTPFLTINSPKKTREDYITKFSFLNNKPLAEKEIVSLAKIQKSNFEQVYLPRMRELSLILEINKPEKEKDLLSEFFEIKRKRNTKKYFILTPKTSNLIITLKEILERLGNKIPNYKNIKETLRYLEEFLKRYEVLSKDLDKLREFEKRFYKDRNGLLENDLLIHKHVKVKDNKILSIPLNKSEIDNYSFFISGEFSLDNTKVSLSKVLRINRKGNKRIIKFRILSKELNKSIGKLIIIRKAKKFYIPSSIILLKYIFTISLLLSLLIPGLQINLDKIIDCEFNQKVSSSSAQKSLGL